MPRSAIDFETWLASNTAKLRTAGISSARLDCLILAEDVTGKDRAWLLAHPEHILEDHQIDELNKYVTQRKRHLPLAYIRGRSEFYGRTFIVNRHVLEPRPESEDIISLLKQLPLPDRPDGPAVIDVGTGSGALAVTTKLELPHTRVYGTDIDPVCLETARRNARQLQADVSFVAADLLVPRRPDDAMPGPDIILANLPYVPDGFHINPAAMNEPRLAIFGGPDGLNPYRRMFTQVCNLEHRPVYILTEALPPQHGKLADIAKQNGYSQEAVAGFVQLFSQAA